MRVFTTPDGTRWGVEARSPSSSTVMVVFRHPDGRTSRFNRYAWHNWHGPESRSVTSRVKPDEALKKLTDEDIALLFRRSAPISAAGNPLNRAS